ncbi:MAG TPA: 4a-hydroxytetrahydrobiopterin dehydratase [Abditibacteriaceae bacterium]|jgi:4a-hydroxytetrahydrobiopterin dehydratase
MPTLPDLPRGNCTACRKGAPVVTEEEIEKYLPQLHPDWKIINRGGIPRLERVLHLKNFVQAMELAQGIGEIAEEQGHHPALLVEWGLLTVSWWTHAIANLHRNDFIMAAKTDRLVKQLSDAEREISTDNDH